MQAVGAVAAVAGPVASTVGGFMEAQGELRQAKDQAESLFFQANQMDTAAMDSIVDLERERAAVAGAQRAAFGASGVKVNVGSPMTVLAETHYRADVQHGRIKRVAEAESAILRTNARSILKTGQQRYTSSLITTVGNLVGKAGGMSLGGK